MRTAMNKKGDNVVMPGRAVSLTDNMFISRVEELNQLPATRELMGEVIDPAKAYLNTISDMSSTLAGLNFYRNAKNTLGVNIDTALNDLNAGKRPLIVRNAYDRPAGISSEQISRDEDYLRNLGYEEYIVRYRL